MKTNLRAAAIAMAIPFAMLSLTACGNDSVTSADSKSSVKDAIAAVTLAESEVGGKAFELDEEGKSGWDIDVVVNDQVTEVRVNAKDTEITKKRQDGRIDLDDARRVAAATVPMSDAITTAAKEVVGLVTHAELSRHRATTLVWSVEFNDGGQDTEVSVDATTGKVVNVDRD